MAREQQRDRPLHLSGDTWTARGQHVDSTWTARGRHAAAHGSTRPDTQVRHKGQGDQRTRTTLHHRNGKGGAVG
eukprot:1612886-Prymnesium_polylepis.1